MGFKVLNLSVGVFFLLSTHTYGATILPVDWKLQSADKPYSFQFSREQSRLPGRESFRFEIRKGDKWLHGTSGKGSYRSEISTSEFAPVNSTQWYGFSQFLPRDFPNVDSRLVIAQWWANYRSQKTKDTAAPPLSLNYRNGILSVVLRYSDKDSWDDTDPNRTVIYENKNIFLGQWNDFVFQIRWSHKQDGFVNMWLNSKQVLSYKGPVGYNIGPKFKFGLYRDDNESTQIIYFDCIKTGSSYEKVALSCP